MLSAGVNLLRDSDTLRKVTVDYLYHSLRNPKEEVKSRIHQLRVVRSLDEKQYKVLKRELPYIVCGMFNPPYRRTENKIRIAINKFLFIINREISQI